MPKGASRSAEVKVWSCGNEHCPKHRYWPRSHLYLEDYEHFVWGSDKKFRTGEDSCRMPQYLYRAELGPGTKLSPKKCQKPILTVKGGTELNWRVSSVGIEVILFPIVSDMGQD